MTERLIVIGGGGAGISAATTAKRLDPDLKVSLFTEFEDIAYSPCGIPFVYGGEIPRFEDLFLSTVDRYVADGLDMRMETVVTEIDLDRGIITARNQHEGFDKLIVCTGFAWEKPDVPGREPRGPALHQEHPQGDGVRQGARDGQDGRRGRRHAARRRDGRQPRPPRPRGPLHRRGPVGAARGARPRRGRARPRVADQARRDAAPRAPRSRGSSATDRVRAVATSQGEIACDVVDRLPAQGARTRRWPRAAGLDGRHDRRPRRRRPHAHERCPACGRRATSSRSRTG